MDAAIEYLLEGDPSIRWQVMRDLTDASAHDIAAERARVATEGWGARLLAEQADDGYWDGGAYRPGWVDDERPFYDAWTGTHPSLELLRAYGPDPSAPEVRTAIARVRENVRWDYDDSPYFDGEVEPCINGGALWNAAFFGESADPIVATLLSGQLADGGWNCWDEDGTGRSSFHTTICVLEGLLAWERAGGRSEAVTAARLRGEEFLLERRLLWRVSTGDVIDLRFTMPSFPHRWYYDVLRGLDYFRLARPAGDSRCDDAVELIRDKRLANGLFRLENVHQGATHFRMEAEREGSPSRWITLCALRVLRWADSAQR